MVRVQGTVVDPDSSATVKAGGSVHPRADAEVSTEVIPTLTLSYFLNKNIALELFCCFAKLEAEGKGAINGARSGRLLGLPAGADAAISLRQLRRLQALCRRGVQYIHFFSEGNSGSARQPQDRSRRRLRLHAAGRRRRLARRRLVSERRREEDLHRHGRLMGCVGRHGRGRHRSVDLQPRRRLSLQSRGYLQPARRSSAAEVADGIPSNGEGPGSSAWPFAFWSRITRRASAHRAAGPAQPIPSPD